MRINDGMTNNKILAVFFICIALFYLLTLRVVVPWAGSGTDLGLSIIHGLNYFDGAGYFSNGDRYVTDEVIGGGKSNIYPYLSGLIFASPFEYLNINTYVLLFKIISVVSLLVSYFYIFKIQYKQVSFSALIGMSALVLSPLLFEFKEHIRSEFFVLPLVFFTLFYFDKLLNNSKKINNFLYNALLISVLIYVAFYIRTAAIALLPAIFFYEFLKKKNIPYFSLLVASIFIVTVGVTKSMQSNSAHLVDKVETHAIDKVEASEAYSIQTLKQKILGTYSDELASPAKIVKNIKNYYWEVEKQFTLAFTENSILVKVIVYCLLSLMAIGFINIWYTRQYNAYDVFVIFYVIVILLHNTGSAFSRYSIFLQPVIFYYLYIGTITVQKFLFPKDNHRFFILVYGLVLLIYGSIYMNHVNFHSVSLGPNSKSFLSITNYLNTHGSDGRVVLARNPYWLNLLGNVKAAQLRCGVCEKSKNYDQKYKEYIEIIDPKFVLLKEQERKVVGLFGLHLYDDPGPGKAANFMKNSSDFHLEKVLSSEPYVLYEIKSNKNRESGE